MKNYVWVLLFMLWGNTSICFSQYKLALSYTHTSPEIESILHKTNLKRKYTSLEKLENDLKKITHRFKKNNYIFFSIDSLTHDSLNYTAHLFFGNPLWVNDIIIKGLEDWELNEIKQPKLPISLYKTQAYIEQIITYLEENGYPFASAVLQETIHDSNKVKANIEVHKHNYIQWDSIILKGNARLSKSFLYAYFDIKPGKPYKESAVSQVPHLTQSLSFVEELQAGSVSFDKDKAALYLYFDKQNTNQFDGFLGIIPENANTKKMLITGNINLLLNNTMTLGERISLQWKNPDKFSQNLDITFLFPYLFYTRLGLNGEFHLLKQDTSYFQFEFSPGLQYNFKGNNYIKLYYQYKNSRLIAIEHLKESYVLPEHIDYDMNLYGLEVATQQLDYIFNPRKGYALLVSTAIGKHHIIKNNHLNENLYENIKMSSLRIQSYANVSWYIPIKKQWTWLLQTQVAFMYSPNLFENDLYRIGGMQSLRGFIEQSIHASSYCLIKTEIRFLFAKKSFLYAFYDAGWYEKKYNGAYTHDIPFGFGIGTAFDTQAGIFTLNYALGKQKNNPIQLKTGVVNFGYIAVF